MSNYGTNFNLMLGFGFPAPRLRHEVLMLKPLPYRGRNIKADNFTTFVYPGENYATTNSKTLYYSDQLSFGQLLFSRDSTGYTHDPIFNKTPNLTISVKIDGNELNGIGPASSSFPVKSSQTPPANYDSKSEQIFDKISKDHRKDLNSRQLSRFRLILGGHINGTNSKIWYTDTSFYTTDKVDNPLLMSYQDTLNDYRISRKDLSQQDQELNALADVLELNLAAVSGLIKAGNTITDLTAFRNCNAVFQPAITLFPGANPTNVYNFSFIFNPQAIAETAQTGYRRVEFTRDPLVIWWNKLKDNLANNFTNPGLLNVDIMRNFAQIEKLQANTFKSYEDSLFAEYYFVEINYLDNIEKQLQQSIRLGIETEGGTTWLTEPVILNRADNDLVGTLHLSLYRIPDDKMTLAFKWVTEGHAGKSIPIPSKTISGSVNLNSHQITKISPNGKSSLESLPPQERATGHFGILYDNVPITISDLKVAQRSDNPNDVFEPCYPGLKTCPIYGIVAAESQKNAGLANNATDPLWNVRRAGTARGCLEDMIESANTIYEPRFGLTFKIEDVVVRRLDTGFNLGDNKVIDANPWRHLAAHITGNPSTFNYTNPVLTQSNNHIKIACYDPLSILYNWDNENTNIGASIDGKKNGEARGSNIYILGHSKMDPPYIYVLAHEFGHSFGSHHPQSNIWDIQTSPSYLLMGAGSLGASYVDPMTFMVITNSINNDYNFTETTPKKSAYRQK